MSGEADDPPASAPTAGGTPGATPLFVDTGAFYARLDESDAHHQRAQAIFDAIKSDDLPYRPLYTTSYVLTELVTLALARADYTHAATALRRIRASELVTVLHPDAETFARVAETFYRYDDQQISLVDHATGVLARELDADHVFAFDPDDFRTIGLTAVPDDTGEA
jgi:predicted nucleic acid-binding protein